MHEERKTKQKKADTDSQYGNPSYLLERENQIRAKVLSNTIKQKRKEKAVSPILPHCSFTLYVAHSKNGKK